MIELPVIQGMIGGQALGSGSDQEINVGCHEDRWELSPSQQRGLCNQSGCELYRVIAPKPVVLSELDCTVDDTAIHSDKIVELPALGSVIARIQVLPTSST